MRFREFKPIYVETCNTIIREKGKCYSFNCNVCPFSASNMENGKTCVKNRFNDGSNVNCEQETLVNSAKEYLKLIKGEKEMTKSDLKDGMVVETIIGSRRLVLDGKLIDKNGYVDLIDYNDNLTQFENSNDNIIKIYKSSGRYIEEIFNNDALTLLWERKIKSDAKIKLEQIQKQIEDMENKTNELKKSAEELKKELTK